MQGLRERRPPGLRRDEREQRGRRARALGRHRGTTVEQPARASPFDNYATGGATIQVLPRRSGTRSVLKTGVYTTLRLDDPQANQSIFCDPSYSQADFPLFQYGCKPWYAANNGRRLGGSGLGAKDCPAQGHWYSNWTRSRLWSQLRPVIRGGACITAPGLTTVRSATTWPSRPTTATTSRRNSCQVNSIDCNYDGNYDGKQVGRPGLDTTGGNGGNVPLKTRRSSARYPRVINLFIVPYQASKGLTGLR